MGGKGADEGERRLEPRENAPFSPNFPPGFILSSPSVPGGGLWMMFPLGDGRRNTFSPSPSFFSSPLLPFPHSGEGRGRGEGEAPERREGEGRRREELRGKEGVERRRGEGDAREGMLGEDTGERIG